jgi:transposase-like protein
VVTDKLPAYERAIKREFYTMKKPRLQQHVKLKNIREGTNNNIVETLHGTVRESRKVMRGLDNNKTAAAMLEGNRIYTTTI